jgi:hypothetical protein
MNLRQHLAWLTAVAGVTSGALLLLPAAQSESKGGNKAVVIATASVRGEVTPCG